MSKTILVVDDEMLIALDIRSQLEALGHRVLVAPALAEAFALLDKESVDVAIVDWHLRNEISAPLVDLLRARQIPFIVCSASGLDELTGLFPAAPILIKPFATGDLIVVLERVVDGATLH